MAAHDPPSSGRTGTAERLSALVAVMSHDLRGPLSTIATACEILELDLPPDRHAHGRAAIRRAAKRMEQAISDLVDLAHIDSGTLSLHLERYDPGLLLSQLIGSIRDRARDEAVALEQHVGPALPAFFVDQERVLQALSNVVAFALAVVDRGGSLELAAVGRSGWIDLRMRGTAPGVAADQLPHLFDRAGLEGRLRGGGSRLGLAVAKGIVEAHAGTIRAAANEHQGTTFVISLPTGGALGAPPTGPS